MTSLPILRTSLDSAYAHLPVAELDALVESVYGEGVSAEDVEGLFDDIGRGLSTAARSVGRFAQQAAPVVAKAVPSMLSGAATGASVGGPWGALIGAGVGATSGILSQSKNPTARGIGGAIGGVGQLVSSVRGGGAGGAAGALGSIATGALGGTGAGRAARGAISGARQAQAGGGSANALLGMMTRPETLQAILSAAMGPAGSRNLNIGGQQIPVHQLLSALGTVAQRAAHEAAEFDENAEMTPEFAEAAAEAWGLDPEDAESRADGVLTWLALTSPIWANRPPPQVSVQVANPVDPYFPAGEYDEYDEGSEYDEGAEYDENDEYDEYDESAEYDEQWGNWTGEYDTEYDEAEYGHV
jgi:hypothetical protein